MQLYILETNAKILFCIIQRPLPAGHCQILWTLKEFFAAFPPPLIIPLLKNYSYGNFSFLYSQPADLQKRGPPYLRQLFTGWLPAPFICGARLGTLELSPPPLTHASAVNMYLGVGGSLTFVRQMPAISDSVNAGCRREEGPVVQALCRQISSCALISFLNGEKSA